MKLRNLVLAILLGLSLTGCESTNNEVLDTYGECPYCGEEAMVLDEAEVKYYQDKFDRDLYANENVEYDVVFVPAETFKNTHCIECTLRATTLVNEESRGTEKWDESVKHIETCTYDHHELDFYIEADTCENLNNAKCENCGSDVSDVIDNAGGYWCENCDYVK